MKLAGQLFLCLISSVAALPKISAGYDHYVVIDDLGSIWVWGSAQDGRLGLATDRALENPTKMRDQNLGKWTSISAGCFHNLALAQDSTLWSWGGNNAGTLGIGTTDGSVFPTMVKGRKWLHASAGCHHSLAIAADSSLWMWGWDGVENDVKWKFKTSPTKIGKGKWLSVTAGYGYSLALAADSTLWGWGQNDQGQLGDGTTKYRASPTQIGHKKWRAMSARFDHSLGIAVDSSLWSWGDNRQGELGDGTMKRSLIPIKIGLQKWISISAGDNFSLALAADSSLWGWGYNEFSQLGNDVLGAPRLIEQGIPRSKVGKMWQDPPPNLVLQPTKLGNRKWLSISAGEYHSLGIAMDTSLWLWGDSRSLILGDFTIDTAGGFKTRGFQLNSIPNWLDAVLQKENAGNRNQPMVYIPRGVQVGPFFIDKFKVTVGDFYGKGKCDSSRCYFNSCCQSDDIPASNITWQEADRFCKSLGKRLPTEAEWETAFGVDSGSEYYWGRDLPTYYAWINDNQLHPVGQKLPNKFGLYDMCGNGKGEWVSDFEDKSLNTMRRALTDWELNQSHVIKGGCKIRAREISGHGDAGRAEFRCVK